MSFWTHDLHILQNRLFLWSQLDPDLLGDGASHLLL